MSPYMPQFEQVVLSGIRATGRLHVGNLIGAVRHFVIHQKAENRCIYFIADLHTLTTLKNPEDLRGNVHEIATDYLAAGLKADDSIIYAQSSVPEISQLALLLSMVQALGPLQDIPTFKDMVRRNPDNVNVGTLFYPVLMAADILGPKATLVPVGEDQRPNVEFARKLARTFNNRFGDTFVVPEMLAEMVKVPGLDGEKMGKSEADNAIPINAGRKEVLARYLQRGITDPRRVRVTDPGDPYNGCKAVYPFHEIITEGEKDTREIANLCRTASIGCTDCKRILVDRIMNVLEPFQERRLQLEKRPDFVKEILADGGRRARRLFQETLDEVQGKMGLVLH